LRGAARLARIVALNVARRWTQWGNARQSILAADGEHLLYLQLLRQYIEAWVVEADAAYAGFCGRGFSIKFMPGDLHFLARFLRVDAIIGIRAGGSPWLVSLKV
jgi:hypothetical protein